mgnify:CR=1 FL=1
MTDHYIAFLEEQAPPECRSATCKAASMRRTPTVTRDEAQTMTLIVNAVLTAHQGCDAETCSTMWAIKAVTG